MANEPIDPLDYLHGLKVVDIGDLRVARGKTRRPVETCRHLHLTYDPQERRIWCKDCETDVDPFTAFEGLCEYFNAASQKLHAQQVELREAQVFAARSLAVKKLDEVWRGRNSVPACRCCNRGLLPEDFKSGVATVSAEFERKRRAREKAGGVK